MQKRIRDVLLSMKKDREVRNYPSEQKETEKEEPKTNETGDMRGGPGPGRVGKGTGVGVPPYDCMDWTSGKMLMAWKEGRGE